MTRSTTTFPVTSADLAALRARLAADVPDTACPRCGTDEGACPAWCVARDGQPTRTALHGLLDRSFEAHYLAEAVDGHEGRQWACTAVHALDSMWGVVERFGLVEDDADRLGLAVFAAYVTVVENAVDEVRGDYAGIR